MATASRTARRRTNNPMIDELTTQDLIVGGGAFVAGLLVSALFGTQPAPGGCGCNGGHGHAMPPSPQNASTDTLGRLRDAKRINAAPSVPSTFRSNPRPNNSQQKDDGTLGAISGGPDREWLFCSAGIANYCVGQGIGVTNDGVAYPLPGTTCEIVYELDGICGGGDYFLTIPEIV